MIGYKFTKAILQLASFGLLLLLEASGKTAALHQLAQAASQSWTHALTRDLARFLTTLSTPVALRWIELALAGDGLFSSFEGYVLYRGWKWGSWLVIAATGALLPFEIRELAVRASLSHGLLLAANTAIALYLVCRQLRET